MGGGRPRPPPGRCCGSGTDLDFDPELSRI
jgi:hypothetical protein